MLKSHQKMKTAALVTCRQFPRLTFDDRKLVKPLFTLGVKAIPVIWDVKNINWKDFDIVIIRSPWDYHLNAEAFRVWIKKLAKENINLWNRPDAVSWNINKKYLLDLKKRGIPVIETVLSSSTPLPRIMVRHGWDEVIIKPVIGASAYKIQKISRRKAENFQFPANEEFLIQPFIQEIQTAGEFSFVFIAGKYSHAVLKKVKRGDFKTNYSFREGLELINPNEKLLIQVESIIKAIPFNILYARIDCVVIKNKLHLMEAEIIEPELFLRFSTTGAQKLAETIRAKILAS